MNHYNMTSINVTPVKAIPMVSIASSVPGLNVIKLPVENK